MVTVWFCSIRFSSLMMIISGGVVIIFHNVQRNSAPNLSMDHFRFVNKHCRVIVINNIYLVRCAFDACAHGSDGKHSKFKECHLKPDGMLHDHKVIGI